MIRKIKSEDKSSLIIYFASKLNISVSDAAIKVLKIIKNGLPSLILESKDIQGVCWIEKRAIGDKKEKYIEILCNNWRLAESFLNMLRWQLSGEYWFSLPRHDFLNRTLNKNGIRFVRVEGDKNIYSYKFEKREFRNYKLEDNEG
jgi:hypothetical protein